MGEIPREYAVVFTVHLRVVVEHQVNGVEMVSHRQRCFGMSSLRGIEPELNYWKEGPVRILDNRVTIVDSRTYTNEEQVRRMIDGYRQIAAVTSVTDNQIIRRKEQHG